MCRLSVVKRLGPGILNSEIPRERLTKGASQNLSFSEERENAGGRYRIYSLVFRQSFIKQQSIYGHCPFDLPKQGVFPSAVWMAWINSGFFIFPGSIPSSLAFIFISGMVMRLSATFVAVIFIVSLSLF
jgi:hypothetical protein